MKRRGGDGGRTMVVNRKGSERRKEMEDLCMKLTSLIPQDYQLDTTSQGPADLPSQLTQATTYIKGLRERVEKLKKKRDDYHSRAQHMSKRSCGNVANATAPGSSQNVRVKFSGSTHFEVNLTMASDKCVELYKVIRTTEQDGRVEVVEAGSFMVDDGKIAHTIKCRARSSEAFLDASMVETRLRMLLEASFAKPEGLAD